MKKMQLTDFIKKLYRYVHHRLRWRWIKLYRWVMCRFFAHLGYPAPKSLINEHQLRPQYAQALRYLQDTIGAENIGDYFEFGVCQGTSLLLMYNELLNSKLDHVRLFGFDSFAGLPPDNEGIWKTGMFAVDYEQVVQSLDDQGIDWDRVTIIKGLYNDTLTDALIPKHGLRKASLIMIDCDLYSSAKEALDFCKPLILDETIIFFDEWNIFSGEDKGEKRAFEEFLQENPEFRATSWSTYSYWPGDNFGKVFRVSRTESS
jgi:O-methyltransferase